MKIDSLSQQIREIVLLSWIARTTTKWYRKCLMTTKPTRSSIKIPHNRQKESLMKTWPNLNEGIISMIVCTRNSEVLMDYHLISMVC